MIDILYAIIMLGMCILGMLSAFFLGTRKYQERVFESSKKTMQIEDSDVYQEPTEEEYQKALTTWMYNGPNKSEQETG